MTTEEKIIAILNETCGTEEGGITQDMELFEEGLLDSFGVLELLISLEDTFGVSIQMETLSRNQIATPAKIAQLIQELTV